MTDPEFTLLHAIADGRRTFSAEHREVARALVGRGLIVTKDFPASMRGAGSREPGFVVELTAQGRTELATEIDRRRPPG